FPQRRLAPRARQYCLRRALDAVVRIQHMNRDAYCPALVGERAADRMPYPPRGVRRKAITAGMVEPLDRLHEADVPLLNQIDEWKAPAVVTARNGHHQSQVRLDELVFHDARVDRSFADLGREFLVGRRCGYVRIGG